MIFQCNFSYELRGVCVCMCIFVCVIACVCVCIFVCVDCMCVSVNIIEDSWSCLKQFHSKSQELFSKCSVSWGILLNAFQCTHGIESAREAVLAGGCVLRLWSQLPGIEYFFHYPLVVWGWENGLTTHFLTFPSCKMGIFWYLPNRVVVKTNWINKLIMIHYLERDATYSKCSKIKVS